MIRNRFWITNFSKVRTQITMRVPCKEVGGGTSCVIQSKFTKVSDSVVPVPPKKPQIRYFVIKIKQCIEVNWKLSVVIVHEVDHGMGELGILVFEF